MHQWRHPLPVDDARRLCWIIKRNQGVVIAAMLLGEGCRRDVGVERSDVPRTDSEDVGHGQKDRGAGAPRWGSAKQGKSELADLVELHDLRLGSAGHINPVGRSTVNAAAAGAKRGAVVADADASLADDGEGVADGHGSVALM